ncbi:MAG: CRISPR-associated endonuclease Cas2 [Syntrophomonadaceae bacterium]
MVIISYDISDDKKRRKFSKFISKFGHRLQYSVYEIENSERILNNIIMEIQNRFELLFDQSDSVYIIRLNPNCQVLRFGYAKNDESDMIFIE